MTTPLPALLLSALLGACARGAANPPVTEPGAPPPTSAPAPTRGPTRAEPPTGGASDFDAGAEGVGVRRLGRWTQSGIGEPQRLVFRDERSLAEFWTRLGTGELPAVDFGRELVVAAAAGQQAGGGHSIAVGRAVLRKGELVVEVVEASPGPDCMTTQALTQPVDVVAIPAEGVERWKFVERKAVGGCGG